MLGRLQLYENNQINQDHLKYASIQYSLYLIALFVNSLRTHCKNFSTRKSSY